MERKRQKLGLVSKLLSGLRHLFQDISPPTETLGQDVLRVRGVHVLGGVEHDLEVWSLKTSLAPRRQVCFCPRCITQQCDDWKDTHL